LRGDLEERSRRGDLAARVHFHGWVTPDAATAIMRTSDLLIMPSLSEGLPLVGLQALGLGLALATSDHPSFTDLVQDGVNGFTLPGRRCRSLCPSAAGGPLVPQRLAAMRRASRKIAPRFEAGRVARQMEELGQEAEAKIRYVQGLGAGQTAAIGNGRNDRLMLKEAALSMAVVQTEGTALEAFFAADLVTVGILDALDLLLFPQRLKATLRS
jgi:hypothetical protein